MVLSIDEIVQNAHAFDPRAPTTTDLRPAVEALFDELEATGIDYVLVGGVALLSYVEGRNTQDIALIVSPDDLGKLPWGAEAQARAALYETDVLMLHQGAQGATVDDAALLERLRPHLSVHDIAELRGILDEQRARRRFT